MTNDKVTLIVGGAGCIGSEVAGALLRQNRPVRVLDNLSSGSLRHIEAFQGNPLFEFIEGDVGDYSTAAYACANVEEVWHFAAKTDIKFLEDYDFNADVRENFDTTWTLLRAMREEGVPRLAFASSAAVYGDRALLQEDLRPAPVSMYGATKLACEAVIRALALRDGLHAWQFRFCSIVSGKFRRGGNMVVPDFVRKLRRDPKRLVIYGDGNQTKPSLHVSECVEAMLYVMDNAPANGDVWNIGAPDAISVTRQAEIVCRAMGLRDVEFVYTGGAVGWPGDVASFHMNVDKVAALGWRARRTSEEAVILALAGLLSQPVEEDA